MFILAEDYLNLLLTEGATKNIDDDFEAENMKLPSYADPEKIKR